jgi:hypothetical protein
VHQHDRNIAIFSADMDSFDFKMRKPEQVRQSVMEKLKKHGKGCFRAISSNSATAITTNPPTAVGDRDELVRSPVGYALKGHGASRG